MRTMMMIALAAVAACVGCKSVEVDKRGQSLAMDGNGEVVRDKDGKPILIDRGWKVDYFQHWNWQKFDSLDAQAGEAKLSINNYQSGADTNLTVLVERSMDGATKLVTAVGEAYVKIAGGGAQADTVLQTASRVVNYFRGKGGDLTNATVTAGDGKLRLSDGTTSIECDAAGNCSE